MKALLLGLGSSSSNSRPREARLLDFHQTPITVRILRSTQAMDVPYFLAIRGYIFSFSG